MKLYNSVIKTYSSAALHELKRSRDTLYNYNRPIIYRCSDNCVLSSYLIDLLLEAAQRNRDEH